MAASSRNKSSDFGSAVRDPGSPTDPAARRNPLQVIWLRRWFVVAALITSLAIGILRIFLATPLYQATAKVYVEQSGPRLINGDPTGVMTATSNYNFTQCELIRSRSILGGVAQRTVIRDLQTFQTVPDIVGALQNSVVASVGRRDDIITIAVRTQYRDEAAPIADAIVDEFKKYQESQHKQSAAELFKILQKARDSSSKELQAEYARRTEFQRDHASLSLGSDHASAIVERLNQLSGALTLAQLETLQADASYRTTKAMMDDPIKIQQLLNAPSFRGGENSQLRHELRELQQQFSTLSANYLPGYSGLGLVQGKMKQLAQDLAAEDRKTADAYLAELEAKRSGASARQDQIRTMLNEQQKQVLILNTAAADYALIEANIRRLERECGSLDDRLKEIDITKDVGGMNTTIVETAHADGAPVEPDKSSIMLYAVALGLAAGVGLAFLREFSDGRLRSVDEIKGLLGLPMLGVVPRIQQTRTISERGLQLQLNPMSDVAEAYRTVRTAVYFGLPEGAGKTLLVTSPAPGDGKSTLASNLAIAMAQAGSRVLLLDADFRKPVQHRIFELDSRAGLSTVLAGEGELEQSIHSTATEGLFVLPCGPVPTNPSEILNSQTFADLLDKLTARFDHIVIDSPPVIPVTDARILAASCDGTVLALRAEKSTRKGAIYARDVLQAVGCRLIGVVVNDVPRRKGIYGYYYTDAEVYAYGYGRSKTAPKKLPAQPAPKEIV